MRRRCSKGGGRRPLCVAGANGTLAQPSEAAGPPPPPLPRCGGLTSCVTEKNMGADQRVFLRGAATRARHAGPPPPRQRGPQLRSTCVRRLWAARPAASGACLWLARVPACCSRRSCPNGPCSLGARDKQKDALWTGVRAIHVARQPHPKRSCSSFLSTKPCPRAIVAMSPPLDTRTKARPCAPQRGRRWLRHRKAGHLLLARRNVCVGTRPRKHARCTA